MKKRENGFVLIETLIVVLLLTVTLMSLYSSFAYMINKTREKSNHDSIESLYKTYFVKDVLDSNYSTATGSTYPDSFLYYVKNTVPSNICKVIGYDGTEGTRDNADVRKIIVCDYENYADNAWAVTDPLRGTIISYNIEKIYYLDFSAINTADQDDRLKIFNNYFDGSTIDYVVSQGKTATGNVLVIKYSKDYNDPVKDREGVKITLEKYHSSISLTEVSKRNTALPIYLYADPNTVDGIDNQANQTAYRWNSYLNGASVTLPSNIFEDSIKSKNEIFAHYGQILLGWTNDGSKRYTVSEFESCKAKTYDVVTNGGVMPAEECYAINDTDYPMTVTDLNRKLYAVWCGDYTIGGSSSTSVGLVECQARVTPSNSNGKLITDGVYMNISGSSKTFSYIGDITNNYFIYSNNISDTLNSACFRIIGNFGKDYYKAIYAGNYNNSSCTYNNNLSLGGINYTYDEGWTKISKWYTDNFESATNVFDKSVAFCKMLDGDGSTGTCADGTNYGVGYLYASELDTLNNQSARANKKNVYMGGGNTSYWITTPKSLGDNRYVVNTSGNLGTVRYINSWGPRSQSLRPVVAIKKTAKILHGKGTSTNPYILTNN